MNLYNLYVDPESLSSYDMAGDTVPSVAWEKHFGNKKEMKNREYLWAQEPKYAYAYARFIKNRFPEGEAAIAKKPHLAYSYAIDILKGRFLKGEPVIAQSPHYAFYYAKHILKGPFPAGEAAIARDPVHSMQYAELLKYLDKILSW